MNVIQYVAFEDELEKLAGAKRVRRIAEAFEKETLKGRSGTERWQGLGDALTRSTKKWSRRAGGEQRGFMDPALSAAYRKRIGVPRAGPPRVHPISLAGKAIKAGPKAPTPAIGITYKAANKLRKHLKTLGVKWEGGPVITKDPLRKLRGPTSRVFRAGDKAIRKTKGRVLEALRKRRRAKEQRQPWNTLKGDALNEWRDLSRARQVQAMMWQQEMLKLLRKIP